MSSREHPALSVVAIAKNEEVDLPGFLASFLPFADEIVIIDDGSTDATALIAQRAGPKVRFICSPRSADEGFCHQRQKGVDAAKGEWVLQVDCDMRLTPELAAEIRAVIPQNLHDAYRFRLQQYWMNRRVRYGGFQFWNQHWLARRSAIRGWTQKVHERLLLNVPSERIGQLNGRMIHLNDIDFLERLRKNHQYSALEVDRLIREGEQFPLHKLLTVPMHRFFRSYFLMLGFLDGGPGFAWAIYQFAGTATIYLMGWSRLKGGNRAELDTKTPSALTDALR